MTTPWQAAGFNSEEEWAAAGWPKPINPETGERITGPEEWRMMGGRHWTGRKMTDEDWFNPKTQWMFDFLRQQRAYRNPLWTWYQQMQAKYPNYPMPGINIEDLLRQAFPDWYKEQAAEAVGAPTAPQPRAAIGISPPPAARISRPEQLQKWLGWAKPEAKPALVPPISEMKEPWQEREAQQALQRWLGWRAGVSPELQRQLGRRPMQPTPPISGPTVPLETLLERAKALLAPPAVPQPYPGVPTAPKVVTVSGTPGEKLLDIFKPAAGAALEFMGKYSLPITGLWYLIQSATQPAYLTERGVGRVALRYLTDEPLQVDAPDQGYVLLSREERREILEANDKGRRELARFLNTLDEDRRNRTVNEIARITYSGWDAMHRAAMRINDLTEYETWARHVTPEQADIYGRLTKRGLPIDLEEVTGDLVKIEPGVPLAQDYYPVEMYDPGVITEILRQEERPVLEFMGQTILDPLWLIPLGKKVAGALAERRAPRLAEPVARLAEETPAQYAERVFGTYYTEGKEVPSYIAAFMERQKSGKPGWFRSAIDGIFDKYFTPLSQRYAAWKARGAPEVILALPETIGDAGGFTRYMQAAANAEEEVMKAYALVYPRAGTTDPNFLETLGKAMSGGLNPAQLREMRALRIEAEAAKLVGNEAKILEKMAALEKIAKEGLSPKERVALLKKLFRTKAGSMMPQRPSPQMSRDIMADNFRRVLGIMFEDMPSGTDRAAAAIRLRNDPGMLLPPSGEFPHINSEAGLHAYMIAKKMREDEIGNLAWATGLDTENPEGGWAALDGAARRIAAAHYYPTPRLDPWQRLVNTFYGGFRGFPGAVRLFLGNPAYPIGNLVSNFTNLWGRHGQVRPDSTTNLLAWLRRFVGDSGYIPPGSIRRITSAGEYRRGLEPTLEAGRVWTFKEAKARVQSGRPQVKREPPNPEALQAMAELERKGVSLGAKLKRVKPWLPLGEGWVELSRDIEENASLAEFRRTVEELRATSQQPGRGFFDPFPEEVETDAELRAAIDEIRGSTLNWKERVEAIAKLYGYEGIEGAPRYVSTERIRLLGGEAQEIADDLMAELSTSPSKSAWYRRYQIIEDGVKKHVDTWKEAEPELVEVELPPVPTEGIAPEEATRLFKYMGTTRRNQWRLKRVTQMLFNLAEKSGLTPQDALRKAAVALDKAMGAYSAWGTELQRLYDEYGRMKEIYGGDIWPRYQERRNKLAATSHRAFDQTIINAAIELGGDAETVKQELALVPWGPFPTDDQTLRTMALQDDVINTVYTMQAMELPLAPEGVETPSLETITTIREWVKEKPLAAQTWLDYMQEAIDEAERAEEAEKVLPTPARQIQQARREAWIEGSTRRLELMERKTTRLQEELATLPQEARTIQEMTANQEEIIEWQTELEALKETLKGLPTQREVFRLWDYKEGTFRNVQDPSGRVAEYAQSQIIQEIAHEKYGLEQSTQGAEQYGKLIKQRLEVNDRIKELENLIWEEPKMILPETIEGLRTFITESEPQLEQMMLYEREPYLFENALKLYEEAVDRLMKMTAGEAIPETRAAREKELEAELERIEREKAALETQMTLTPTAPEERVAEAVGAEIVPKVGDEVVVANQRLVAPTVPLKEGDKVIITEITPEGYIKVDKPEASHEVRATLKQTLLEPDVFGIVPPAEAVVPEVADEATRIQQALAQMEGKTLSPSVAAKKAELEARLAQVTAPETARPGIPAMITTPMREALRQLGYAAGQVVKMTPAEAWRLIEESGLFKAPKKDPFDEAIVPPSPREAAELKRDMLIQRMREYRALGAKTFDAPPKIGEKSNFAKVLKWMETLDKPRWAQYKTYLGAMGEAATDWGLHSYRKFNFDNLLARGMWWPYWQTRNSYKWAKHAVENPHFLATWLRLHLMQRKINDELEENLQDSVAIPDWVPIVGGQYLNPYWLFDPIYPLFWGVERVHENFKQEGLKTILKYGPISPILGLEEAMDPFETAEGMRVGYQTPWTRALGEATGINLEAMFLKGLETGYAEVKPSIYQAIARGGAALGAPGLAERILGGPEVTPIVTEAKFQPTYMQQVLIDMWLAGEITLEECEEASYKRSGPIWEKAEAEVRGGRGLTEFASVLLRLRPRKLHPSQLEINKFKERWQVADTMAEGPEKRAYIEETYELYPFGQQYNARYKPAERAAVLAITGDAWDDIDTLAVKQEAEKAEKIRQRPGDWDSLRQLKDDQRAERDQKERFWEDQGVSFLFNPRTRTIGEINEYVKGQILGLFYDRIPQAEDFLDEEGNIDWDTYREGREAFWKSLPEQIVTWEDVKQLDIEVRDVLGRNVNVLALAKEVANEEAYNEWTKANDIPEEALMSIWQKYLIDPANEYWNETLKPLDPADRDMRAFFLAYYQQDADVFVPFIMQEYPGRWTEEELRGRLKGITMPGIWENWNLDNTPKETAISLLWAFYQGQSELGRRRFREALNDPIFNQFFLNRDTRNYERITDEELEGWLTGPNGLWTIPSPWEDPDEALRTLYRWQIGGEPITYPAEEPEATGGRPPGKAMPAPMGEGTPPEPETAPPPEVPQVPTGEAPTPQAPPQLAGMGESQEYAQALREMEAWVAAGRTGDWTPLMEKWFGDPNSPSSLFWDYYWEQIPPGDIGNDVRQDPIISMILNKAFRTVYEVKPGVYEQALDILKKWREAHPEVPGDPKEWAVVRQIVNKYWELKDAGATNEASALWQYFLPLLSKYYESARRATMGGGRRGYRTYRGGSGGGRSRWPWPGGWGRYSKYYVRRYYPRR